MPTSSRYRRPHQPKSPMLKSSSSFSQLRRSVPWTSVAGVLLMIQMTATTITLFHEVNAVELSATSADLYAPWTGGAGNFYRHYYRPTPNFSPASFMDELRGVEMGRHYAGRGGMLSATGFAGGNPRLRPTSSFATESIKESNGGKERTAPAVAAAEDSGGNKETMRLRRRLRDFPGEPSVFLPSPMRADARDMMRALIKLRRY